MTVEPAELAVTRLEGEVHRLTERLEGKVDMLADRIEYAKNSSSQLVSLVDERLQTLAKSISRLDARMGEMDSSRDRARREDANRRERVDEENRREHEALDQRISTLERWQAKSIGIAVGASTAVSWTIFYLTHLLRK